MNNVKRMKKISLLAMVGIMCAALIGCGGQENSTGGSTVNNEQDAEEFLEQLDEEYQASVEAEEEQHEAELEAEYPEGILPAGIYKVPEGTSQDIFLRKFDAGYDFETGEGTIHDPGASTIRTITNEALGGNADSYRYDSETGLYHFEVYVRNNVTYIFEGYYNAEDDSFTVTHYTHYTYYDGVLDPEKTITTEDGYEQVYYRE